ncbi:WhiB family transcriptional regulator [Streptomyces sp. NPDC059718]
MGAHHKRSAQLLSSRAEWERRAACIGEDIEVFFPEAAGRGHDHYAKNICRGCPVRTECLIDALENEGGSQAVWHRHGIRGGMTPRERVGLDSSALALNPEPQTKEATVHLDPNSECGTRTGYRRHLELGETPCGPCTVAHTAIETELDLTWSAIQPARIEPRGPRTEARQVVSPFAGRPRTPKRAPREKELPPIGRTPAAVTAASETPTPKTPDCGTPEAYRRHEQRGEAIDPTCWNAHQRRRRTKTPTGAVR